MWDPLGREAVNCLRGRKELELGPISARDAHVNLGKSLYLSGPIFLHLGLCGEVGWEIIFSYCQGHQASLTFLPHSEGGVTIRLNVSFFR